MQPNGVKVIHINFSSAAVDPVYFPQIEVVGDVANAIWRIMESTTPQNSWDFDYFATIRQRIEELMDGVSADDERLVHELVDDLRAEFVADYVFPAIRANAIYEGYYLLGTSLARPIISKGMMDAVKATGADAIAHGATGKGNDQVRFELSYYALNPDIKVVAPWREWDFVSRSDLIEFAEKHQIPVARDKRGEAPFSVDANLLHSSSEGKVLEDPNAEPPPYVYQRTIAPEDAPDTPTVVTVGFRNGDPVSIDGNAMSPATLLTKLNELGHDNGIGRVDLVENRFVGMKSRGVYETPGGTILLAAHRVHQGVRKGRRRRQ